MASAGFFCGEKPMVETEPNNSFDRATTITVGKPVAGTLAGRDDRDFFRLEITEPAVFDIELSPVRGINHSFKIWKGLDSPVMIKQVDDLRKSSPERMCNLYAVEGSYFISVEHGEKDVPRSGSEDRYVLTVKGRPPGDEEREPNDEALTANPVEINREITGYFSPAYNRLNRNPESPMREEDWFVMTPGADTSGQLLLDVVLSGVPGVNSVLYLYGPSMKLLGRADAEGPGHGEILKGIGVKGNEACYILVTTKNYSSNNDVPYSLIVSSRVHDPKTEMEPNNNVETANMIMEGLIGGTVYPKGDSDYFRYRGDSARGIYRIEAVPPLSMDIRVKIINGAGETLQVIDNGGAGFREVFPNLPTGDDFYIQVYSTDAYSDSESEYRLSVSPVEFAVSQEREPNDVKENATVINETLIYGFVSKKNDVDYFSVKNPGRMIREFKLKGIKEGRLRFSVTDPLGYIIKTEEIEGDRSVTIRETIDQRGYIIVEAVKENFDAPYIISIGESR